MISDSASRTSSPKMQSLRNLTPMIQPQQIITPLNDYKSMLGYKPEPHDASVSLHDINSVSVALASVKVTARYLVHNQNEGSRSPPSVDLSYAVCRGFHYKFLGRSLFPSQYRT